MRKIIVLTMISMDGIMQAPGGPEEDTANGFKYGGWTAPYGDEESGKILLEELKSADYLLGRKTFQIWENYWPEHGDFWPSINKGTKFVLSNTVDKTNWKNTVFLQNEADIKELKNSDGSHIQVWGSSELVHLLLQHDLVDELRLKIYPVILGKGKKLFADESAPAAYTLVDSMVTKTGVVFANYKRAGEVKTGSIEV